MPEVTEAMDKVSLPIFQQSFSANFSDFIQSPKIKKWMALDFVFISIASVFGMWISPWGKIGAFDLQDVLFCASFAVIYCTINLGTNLYDRFKHFHFRSFVIASFINISISIPIALATNYFIFYNVMGRKTITYAAICTQFILILSRLFLSMYLKKYPYRFTIIGESKIAPEIDQFFNHHGNDFPFNFVPWENVKKNTVEDTLKTLNFLKIADIGMTEEAFHDPQYRDTAFAALQHGYRLVSDIDLYVYIFQKIPIDCISDVWILKEMLNSRHSIESFVKRLSDIIIGILGLILGAPIIAMIALIIKLTDHGPVLYKQERVGQFFHPFTMYKFRTMFINDNTEQSFTEENDPRVTWIGRLIRPLHLDELPQLWNILKGDMSLIGPRPEAYYFARKISAELPHYKFRYMIRPGLSGLAQIKLGYIMDNIEGTKKKLSYDLYYVFCRNIFKDIEITLQTLFHLAKGSR
jgi:exopolysaccharide biosynthesis polyprenyl glycosylphosphotransferase